MSTDRSTDDGVPFEFEPEGIGGGPIKFEVDGGLIELGNICLGSIDRRRCKRICESSMVTREHLAYLIDTCDVDPLEIDEEFILFNMLAFLYAFDNPSDADH